MTPKEKAEELIFNFSIVETSHFNENMDGLMTMEQIGYHSAKQCALICCNEVLGYMGADRGYEFWVQVKQEIEKL